MEPKIVVAWMEAIRGNVSVSQACQWLGIARASYYRWRAAFKSAKQDQTTERIRELCAQHKFRYGYRKITALLRLEQRINHKRVQRIMQTEHL